MRAVTVFLESYYNTPSVDVRARVLLQAAAFEILFDLPDWNQRAAYRDAIEKWISKPADKKYRFSYEAAKGKKLDTRTLPAIWADRFYTLRSHIVHGEDVRRSKYVFGEQRHLVASPLFFVLAIDRMINDRRVAASKKPAFFDKIRREEMLDDYGNLTKRRSFRIVTDYGAMILSKGLLGGSDNGEEEKEEGPSTP